MREEFYENKLLRTQILSLALANNDFEALDKFKARLFPIQLEANMSRAEFNFAEYYDEAFIKNVAASRFKVFDYFLEEYKTQTYGGKQEITWIYPFLGELIGACIKNKDFEKATKAIEVVINHNKTVYELMRKTYLLLAKKINDSHYSRSYPDALEMVKREYHVDQNKCFVSLSAYFVNDVEPLSFNIIHVDCTTRDNGIQSRIDELNRIYNDILNLPNHFIKNS